VLKESVFLPLYQLMRELMFPELQAQSFVELLQEFLVSVVPVRLCFGLLPGWLLVTVKIANSG
jgi:hypothetical protein